MRRLITFFIGLWALNNPLVGNANPQDVLGGYTMRDPDQIIKTLIEGNKTFMIKPYTTLDTSPEVREPLVKGQKPIAAVLTCSDSRVPAELIFQQSIGQLFVIRVAGNVASPVVIESVEFALEVLDVPVLFIMGHHECGAVMAAMDPNTPADLSPLMDLIKPAVLDAEKESQDPTQILNIAIQKNVINSYNSLMDNSPTTRKLVESNKVKVVLAEYNLATGEVELLSR